MTDVERDYEFWLLGLPGENVKKSFEKIRKITRNSCVCFEFSIPPLRVGTLDLLVKASTDLQKLETTITEVISRITNAVRDVLGMDREAMRSNLLVKSHLMPHYLHKFSWQKDAYPSHLAIKAIEDIISREVTSVAGEVKKHLDEYTTIKHNLDAMERSQKGSLLTRDIAPLVKKEHFVLDSEHLITAVVVVPRQKFSEWLSTYELLDEEVVPRSSKLLFEEGDFGLFNVTLFKRRLPEFSHRARELRFVVRDFTYDTDRVSSEMEYLEGLRKDKLQMDKPLLRLLKNSFSDMYVAYTHLMAMRLFVESILRYGLPAQFLYLFAIVPKKEVKKTRNYLAKEYAYLEMKPAEKESKSKKTSKEHYYPYVSFTIRADVFDF